MTTLEQLKAGGKLGDLAAMIDFSGGGLAWILYKTDDAAKYEKFEIPKKSGGTRQICAPKGGLKLAQKKLADLLYECQVEIAEKSPRRSLSFGYRKGHSIVGNAHCHKRKRFVLNLDLKDFFPSINFGRVRGFFLNDKDFALHEKIATVIAQIACFENQLPQGSPCSPVISDMVAHLLDVRLVQLAKKHRVTYSRYADDLTFSTNQKTFPVALAHADPETGKWVLGQELAKQIEKAGFAANPDKTRMQVRPSQQTVTGLTVNDKVNIPQSYWRMLRSMSHALFETGSYYRGDQFKPIAEVPATTDNLEIISGMFGYVHHTKSSANKLANPESKADISGAMLHRRFWFFRYFVTLERPLIVCEGVTDKVYLDSAIKYLKGLDKRLGVKKNKTTFESGVRFFNYENTAHKLLGLTGGSGQLMAFMKSYPAMMKAFKYRPLQHPVIVLVDNDDGLNNIKKELKKSFKLTIDWATPDPFFHLCHNLYLVKTPEIAPDNESCIEDFFEAKVLTKPLDGKTFDDDKDADKDLHFGKVVFAKKIVVPMVGEINWEGFRPLLDRVVKVLDDYDKKLAAP